MASQKYCECAAGALTNHILDSVCPLCSSRQPRTVLSEQQRSLKHCQACNVWWLEPIPGDEELANYFEANGPTEDSAAAARFELNRHAVLSSIATRLKEIATGGRILDVGCATGYFLSTFFGGHKRWETHGIEISPQSADRATNRGIRMQVGSLKSCAYPDSYFDVVTILDTFYYFTAPQQAIRQIERILKPGGIVAIEVPLAAPRLWRTTTRVGRVLTRTSRPRLQTDHVFFYTPMALARIIGSFGLEVTAILPLPANVNTGAVSAVYRTYSAGAMLLWKVTGGRTLLAPRFLMLARRRREA
jgi:SAM-dependent methyltransferase